MPVAQPLLERETPPAPFVPAAFPPNPTADPPTEKIPFPKLEPLIERSSPPAPFVASAFPPQAPVIVETEPSSVAIPSTRPEPLPPILEDLPPPVETAPAPVETVRPPVETVRPPVETEVPTVSATRPAPESVLSPKRPMEAPPRTEEPRRTDEFLYYAVAMVGGEPTRTRLRGNETLAEAAHRLAHALAPSPVDLAGNWLGWYRMEQGGYMYPGDQPITVLDPNLPVFLHLVPNRTVRTTLRVVGLPEEVRFQAPVGTAIPVRSLIAHLQRWLGLPDAEWRMDVGGFPLGAMQILEEFSPTDGLELTLRR